MKTAIIITVVITSLLLIAGTAWAKQQGGPDGEHRSTQMMERIGKRLDLDDQQKSNLSLFSEKWQAMHKAKKEERKGGRQKLMDLLDAATLDREKALALLDERHQLFKSHMQGMVDAFAQFSDSLDAMQRKELKEIFAKRMERQRGGPRWAH